MIYVSKMRYLLALIAVTGVMSVVLWVTQRHVDQKATLFVQQLAIKGDPSVYIGNGKVVNRYIESRYKSKNYILRILVSDSNTITIRCGSGSYDGILIGDIVTFLRTDVSEYCLIQEIALSRGYFFAELSLICWILFGAIASLMIFLTRAKDNRGQCAGQTG
jgi:hypothetical protein